MNDAPVFSGLQIGADDLPEGFEYVTEIKGAKRRWGDDVKYVFRRAADDTLWSFTVYVPATECQEWPDEPITGVRVYAHHRMVLRTHYLTYPQEEKDGVLQ